jgi:hypothetical protein
MSDENDQTAPETPEPMRDQTPPGTPWPDPNRTLDFSDTIPPTAENE